MDKPLTHDIAFAFLLLQNIGVRARTLHVSWDFIISSNTVHDCIGLQFPQFSPPKDPWDDLGWMVVIKQRKNDCPTWISDPFAARVPHPDRHRSQVVPPVRGHIRGPGSILLCVHAKYLNVITQCLWLSYVWSSRSQWRNGNPWDKTPAQACPHYTDKLYISNTHILGISCCISIYSVWRTIPQRIWTLSI